MAVRTNRVIIVEISAASEKISNFFEVASPKYLKCMDSLNGRGRPIEAYR